MDMTCKGEAKLTGKARGGVKITFVSFLLSGHIFLFHVPILSSIEI